MNARFSFLFFSLLFFVVLPAAAWRQDQMLMDGMGNIKYDALNTDSPAQKIYESRCSQCHDNPTGRVPPASSFRYRPAESVYRALADGGVMSPMAKGLTEEEIITLVKLLTGREPRAIGDPNDYLCKEQKATVLPAASEWTMTHGDIRSLRARNIEITSEAVSQLSLEWVYGYPGSAAGPVVEADETLFLAGTGYVVALDAGSGCVRWSYPTGSRIVRAVTVAPLNNSNVVASQGHRSLALFGDDSGTLFALNAATGKEVWRQKVYDHVLARITAAPTVFAGIAYVPISSMEDPLTHDQKHFCCSARGGIAAVDIATGNIVWQKQHFDEPLRHIETQQITGERIFQQGPAGASTYTPLSIDAKRKLVYATTAEEYGFTNAPGPYSVVAYSLNDGELVWQRQLLPAEKDRKRICAERETDCRNFFSAGTSVLLFPASAEKDIAVVGMKSGWVHGLDPSDNGRVIWSTRVAQGGDLGGVMYGLAADSQHVYVPVSDVDSPDGRYTGTLVALDPKTGNIKWRTDPPQAACSWGMEHCVAGQVAAVTVVSDMVFANFWDGLVRIYNAKNGELIRSLDTAVNYKAVNGTAVGGQVSGYPVSVGSRAIYITSGASSVMKSGNALLKLTFDQSTDGQ